MRARLLNDRFTVAIDVRVALVALAVSVHVVLSIILDHRAIVTRIADLVGILVLLFRIISKRTIVLMIYHVVVVGIGVAGITDPILVDVLLSAIRHVRTIVSATETVLAVDAPVGDTVTVAVDTTKLPIAGPTDATLENMLINS